VTAQNLKISDSVTVKQIEEKYTDCIVKQEFYDIDYAFEWFKNNESAIDMANNIKTILKPEKVMDIGCGIGKLVGELREKNIDAYGIEFSDANWNAFVLHKLDEDRIDILNQKFYLMRNEDFRSLGIALKSFGSIS
jgi:2-polyprenyl-3-methyl-5-hydroxy-6-metoxy-1,4-benzoquinol methylase